MQTGKKIFRILIVRRTKCAFRSGDARASPTKLCRERVLCSCYVIKPRSVQNCAPQKQNKSINRTKVGAIRLVQNEAAMFASCIIILAPAPRATGCLWRSNHKRHSFGKTITCFLSPFCLINASWHSGYLLALKNKATLF